jgi:MFS family permease
VPAPPPVQLETRSPDAALGLRRESLRPARLLDAFSALRYYNFRLYFIGLLISVSGTWAQAVAQSWLVYELTNSALVLGQVSFVSAIPVWVLSPWAGVVIDRMPRRTLLLVTQVVQMLQAFALAALTFSGRVEVWHIMVLSVVRGVANAFDAPARQSFYIELVDREELSNAIALNSTLMSMARVVGPSIGGVVVATLGTAWAFTINGISFLAILAGLLIMRLGKPVLQPSDHSPLADFVEGISFIWRTRTIAALIAIALTISVFGSSFGVLLPIITAEVLGRGELAFGVLNTAQGAGSMVGAVMVAYLSSRPRRGRYLSFLNILLPLALLAFALSQEFALSVVLLVVVGLGLTPQLSLTNMLIQSNIPDHIRGRVMAAYTLVIFGMFPVGNLLAGALAEHFGAPWAIIMSAGMALLISVILRITVPQVRTLQ